MNYDYSAERGVLYAVMVCALASPAYAQESTERYIPIGASPGISHELSYIGRIVAVDTGNRTITVEQNGRDRHTLSITDGTQIWLDRSGQGRTNLVGRYADCEVGRRAEVMHERHDPRIAAWIKLAVGQ